MDKRYQVFVSSTYVDLRDERQKVNQTLMEMDCIPAGMELFPATDEEQWEFIKKVIDDCDYYLLIIGGRYGSLSPEGISYTEQEFDYAVKKGIRVVALLHSSPGELPLSKTDASDEARRKLDEFREKVSTGRLVKYWQSGNELPGLVSLSLSKTIKAFPAIGWVRATEGSSEELLREINELRKENSRLKEQLESADSEKGTVFDIDGLAGLDENFVVGGSYMDRLKIHKWSLDLTWSQIFYYVSPYLMNFPDQDSVKSSLCNALCVVAGVDNRYFTIDEDNFHTIAIQLRVLGLIKIESVRGGDVVWSLTSEGEGLMVKLRAVKKV
ncbi:DUF4062 domain-containing protein [Pseudomonas sp. BNK-6]|uniref:DUF4062 domain-containing protein n=1 Tax=unclassified Pseudomonas TaxID=196821 RepID=UPI003A8C7B5B